MGSYNRPIDPRDISLLESLLTLLGLSVVLFASTNVDDVFVLLLFFADPKYSVRDVVIGQYAGIAVLYGISFVASLIALVVPKAYIGLLGLAPVCIGLKKMLNVFRGKTTEEDLERHPNAGSQGGILAVAAVTIANGGDNISIYTPVFAARPITDVALIGVVFATMTGVWCFVARRMVEHPTIGTPIRLYGHRIVPFVLIGLGLIILYEAGSFKMLSSLVVSSGKF